MIVQPTFAAVMIAGVSGLIVLVIFIIIAIVSSFLKKRAESEEDWDLPPELKPRRDELPPVARPITRWEEELRRTLGQHTAPAAPPPIIQHVPPHEVRPVYRHVHEDPTAVEEPHLEVVLPKPQPFTEHVFQPLHGLTESTQRYAQASTLEERVQKHMHGVTGHRIGTTSVHHAELTPEIRALVDSFKTAKGSRAAILASIVLGPPRAFDT